MYKNMIIGVVGGMGSYATSDFFRRLIEAFPGEKEWERPRIIVDNYCTMPSRVRAILYNEKREELINDLSNSVQNMISIGVNKIILACNTSHVFLQDIVEHIPESRNMFVNIIDECGKKISEEAIQLVGLVASEGTIKTRIYEEYLSKYDINVTSPNEEQFFKLREFIENVKQNKVTDECLEEFVNYINNFNEDCVVLGCTELPILYTKAANLGLIINKKIIDPLQCAIDVLIKDYFVKENWDK